MANDDVWFARRMGLWDRRDQMPYDEFLRQDLTLRLQGKGFPLEEAERIAAEIVADPSYIVCEDPDI